MTGEPHPLGAVAREAWADLGRRRHHLDLVRATPAPLPSPLRVDVLAEDAVGVVSLAAQLVGAARAGQPPGLLLVDGPTVAVSAASDRVFRLDGRRPTAFAPLSRFWPTADGWARTHANYPHHAARLRTLLQLPADAGPDQVATVLAGRSAAELEDHAARAGALVVAVRTAQEWTDHPQAHAVAERPLVATKRVGDAPPRTWPDRTGGPLAGIRVLDLTRVIAGPVAARDLALMGAEVLRVDPPEPAEIAWQHLDTGQDKHSAVLDLARRPEVLEALLSRADVVLTGYRPGALDRFGLAAAELAVRRPGIVVGSVSAWGTTGPWAARRGFDSLVQAVTGIAVTESRDGRTPGALPAQALDHASGHLLAAGVVCALADQVRAGGSAVVSVALARTALALQRMGARSGPVDRDVVLDGPTVDGGGIRCAAPVLAHTGAPGGYQRLGAPWGGDPAAWPDLS